MTDSLDQVARLAAPLLRRVDEILATTGAGPEHRVWPQLRRVRLLPGDAVLAVLGWQPAPLAETIPRLRGYARELAEIAADLPEPAGWTGPAADAYDGGRRRVAEHLDGEQRGLVRSLEATADLGDQLATWMCRVRNELAASLAEVLCSAEALQLGAGAADRAADPPGEAASAPGAPVVSREVAGAAADIAARVLRTVAAGLDRGTEILADAAALATPVPAPTLAGPAELA